MTENSGENTVSRISTPKKILREGIRKILPPFVPTEIAGEENLSRTEDLSRKGYGIVMLWNHFSGGDFFPILKDLAFKYQFMQNKEICLPMMAESHHYLNAPFKPLTYPSQVKLYPVINRDSIVLLRGRQRKEYRKAKKSLAVTPDSFIELKERQANERKELASQQKHLFNLYLEGATDTLKKGGIVLIAPQATRAEWLKIRATDSKRKSPTAVTPLIARLDKNKLDQVAFLFVGAGIKNTPNYSRHMVHGINLLKKHTVNIGPTYTKDELKQFAGIQNGQGKTRRGIEKVVLEELAKVVPTEYLNPPPKK